MCADGLEGFDDGIIVGLLLGVRILAEIGEHHRNDIAWRLEDIHAAGRKLLHELRIEQQLHTVDGSGVAKRLLHHVEVHGDAGRAPHVRNGELIAGIAVVQHLQNGFVEVLPIGQLGLVELQECPARNEARQIGAGDVDHVIAGRTRHHLGLDGFSCVVGVIDHLEAGGLFEIGDGGLADVINPVVDLHLAGREGMPGDVGHCDRSGAGLKNRTSGQFHFAHSLMDVPACDVRLGSQINWRWWRPARASANYWQ